MLTSLRMKGYRGFRDYGVGGLARVNLLVGRNNCGKTSILEAVHLLASEADPEVLMQIAEQRGEIVVTSDGREPHRRTSPTPTCTHFFHGHHFRRGVQFEIRSKDGFGETVGTIKHVTELDQQQQFFFARGEDRFQAELALVMTNKHGDEAAPPFIVPLTDEGAPLGKGAVTRSKMARYGDAENGLPVVFIPPASLMAESMSNMWDGILKDRRELEIFHAMRILEPDLEDIIFLSGKTAYSSTGPAGIVAAFRGTTRREPLGSHGDGMRRLLAISLALSQARNGVFLIDEIDTGRHYSIMGDMWRLVVEAAERSDVQVFATTHSLDCVRGLAWLCDNYPALAKDVSVQKIEPTLDESVTLDAGELMVAVDQEIEVR